VRVRLSSTGQTESRQLAMNNYEGGAAKDWSAWFGATQLDGHRGKEILLGQGSGASSQSFYALTVRAGRLRLLTSPSSRVTEPGKSTATPSTRTVTAARHAASRRAVLAASMPAGAGGT